jgi:3'-phosphoadenosine 5'-phosphosulfate sulfotransferase (PAPS reductase)/FAD synthetase
MAALGEIEAVDFAIHADTLNERSETYEFAREWTPWLAARGVPVITSRVGGKVLDRAGALYIPAFTKDSGGARGGQLRRQCTHRWKIIPLRRMDHPGDSAAGVEEASGRGRAVAGDQPG